MKWVASIDTQKLLFCFCSQPWNDLPIWNVSFIHGKEVHLIDNFGSWRWSWRQVFSSSLFASIIPSLSTSGKWGAWPILKFLLPILKRSGPFRSFEQSFQAPLEYRICCPQVFFLTSFSLQSWNVTLRKNLRCIGRCLCFCDSAYVVCYWT